VPLKVANQKVYKPLLKTLLSIKEDSEYGPKLTLHRCRVGFKGVEALGQRRGGDP